MHTYTYTHTLMHTPYVDIHNIIHVCMHTCAHDINLHMVNIQTHIVSEIAMEELQSLGLEVKSERERRQEAEEHALKVR